MPRFASLVFAVGLIGLATQPAQGQESGFGRAKGGLAGLERLAGLYYLNAHVEEGSYDATTKITTVGLPMYGASGGMSISAGPVTAPRGSFDFFVIDRLSVGGSLGFSWSDGEVDVDDGHDTDVGPVSGLVIAGRAGYALPLQDKMGFWFRGGLEILHSSYDGEDIDVSATAYGLTADALYYVTPVAGLALVAGIATTLGLAGSVHWDIARAPDDDYGLRLHGLGVVAGLLGYF